MTMLVIAIKSIDKFFKKVFNSINCVFEHSKTKKKIYSRLYMIKNQENKTRKKFINTINNSNQYHRLSYKLKIYL
jgi:hypothetical protein